MNGFSPERTAPKVDTYVIGPGPENKQARLFIIQLEI